MRSTNKKDARSTARFLYHESVTRSNQKPEKATEDAMHTEMIIEGNTEAPFRKAQ